jgi:hypothetical protein
VMCFPVSLDSWIDGENWQFPVRFSVYDEDVGRDDFIGGASFSSLPFLTTTKRQEVILTLQVCNPFHFVRVLVLQQLLDNPRPA